MSGQNKGLLSLHGKPMIQQVIAHLPDQVDIVISANADIEAYCALGYAVISDELPGQLGPLNGMYSALRQISSEWLLTVPCDTPNLPDDYFTRMMAQIYHAKAYVAHDGKQAHNGCCLLHRSLQNELLAHLQQHRLAVHAFLHNVHAQNVDFSDHIDGFINVNTANDLRQAQARV